MLPTFGMKNPNKNLSIKRLKFPGELCTTVTISIVNKGNRKVACFVVAGKSSRLFFFDVVRNRQDLAFRITKWCAPRPTAREWELVKRPLSSTHPVRRAVPLEVIVNSFVVRLGVPQVAELNLAYNLQQGAWLTHTHTHTHLSVTHLINLQIFR